MIFLPVAVQMSANLTLFAMCLTMLFLLKRGDTASHSLYITGLDAAWEIDIFEWVKRSVEATSVDFFREAD